MSAQKTNSSFDEKKRKLLKLLSLGGAVVAGQSVAGQVRPDRRQTVETDNQLNLEIANARVAERYITVKLLRPFDLLSLELRYYNFSLSRTGLQKKGDPAYLAVIFQPQSISEQAWNETSSGLETPTVPGKMLIGSESRLVFKIPASISAIAMDVNQLLDWEKYEPVVNGRAKQPAIGRRIVIPINNQQINSILQRLNTKKVNKTTAIVRGMTKDERIIANMQIVDQTMTSRADAIINIRENLAALVNERVGPLNNLETSLEIPMRLYLSPTPIARWSHIKKLEADKGILRQTNRLFELWHTRMGTKNKDGGIDESDITIEQRLVRALWADDAKSDYRDTVIETTDSFLGTTSMTNKDRHQIVHESSNFQIPNFVPQPIKAYKLFLSTLGAWLDSELIVERKKLEAAAVLYGNGNSLNLLKWRHIETLGREHYVEIVKAGNIMPFGHEAVLVKITERKPHPQTKTAANFQRKIIVITEPIKNYNYRDSKGDCTYFSFSRVEFITTVSPLLDVVKKKLAISFNYGAPPLMPGEPQKIPGDDQFVIMAGGKQVLFKVKAEDLDGNLVDFTIPLAFVSTDVLGSDANITALTKAYNDGFSVANRTNFNGQKFTLAPQEINGTDTAYTTYEVSFIAKLYKNAAEPQSFLPHIGEAQIIEPSYQKLTGIAKPVSVSLVDDRNDGNVFAKFNFSEPINFTGNTDKTGGLAAPNFNLSGLSKAAGAFGGDIEKFKSASATAESFFYVNSLPVPTLFGVFKLNEILDFDLADKSPYSLAKKLSDRSPKIPNLVTEDTPDAFITSYVIKPNFKSPIVQNAFAMLKPANFSNSFGITTQVKAYKKNLSNPEFSTEAYVKNFKIGVVQLSGEDYLVNLVFKEISFKTTAGKKADVAVEMGDPCIQFGGPLTFLNEINKLIDPKGFSDPPYLDVSLTGIKCGYTLALPNLQLGAFTLSNMSLGAEVNLPFSGAPLTFAFRFCEKQQPFTLTISCLGGGGFFGLELDLNGIRQIEAALEFGAAVSLNLGVASGSVSVMAGIYFKMAFTTGQNSTELTGYVRINGAVSVLGLITASIELYLALTWLIEKEKAFGEASLKIKIEILFFSTSVTIKTQRTFAGSGSDPNFQMALTEGDWQEYCGAFAA